MVISFCEGRNFFFKNLTVLVMLNDFQFYWYDFLLPVRLLELEKLDKNTVYSFHINT